MVGSKKCFRQTWRWWLSVPLLCCRAGCTLSSPFASPCWFISLQGAGFWLLNTLHTSTSCSQLLLNPAHQYFPSVADLATADRAGYRHLERQFPSRRHIRAGWLSLFRETAYPPSLIPSASLQNSIGTWSCQGLLHLLSFTCICHRHQWGLHWGNHSITQYHRWEDIQGLSDRRQCYQNGDSMMFSL